MTITSTAFQNGDPIPPEYGFNGKNVNPPLTFSEVPKDAKSLLLTLEDPDAPGGVFAHWVVYGISPATLQILEGSLPIGAEEATNDFTQNGYGGPKPPSGTHKYYFKLFALDNVPDLQPTDALGDAYKAMKDHVLAQAQLIGTFSA